MVLLFFGPPGSGKGTQSKRITEWLRIPSIATGELFRAEVAAGSPLGLEAQAIMARGGLIGDEIVNRILEKRLSLEDVKGGFLLDGYPRTLPQAQFLDQLLECQGLPEPTVLHLDVPRQILIERVSGRRHCPVCNRVYNVHSQAPLRANTCDDDDGVALEIREDDREDVVRERLSLYDRQTGPLLGYYANRDYCRIDGNLSADAVAIEVAAQLESRLVRVRGRRSRFGRSTAL